jgi:hypothetical protein
VCSVRRFPNRKEEGGQPSLIQVAFSGSSIIQIDHGHDSNPNYLNIILHISTILELMLFPKVDVSMF